MPKPAEVIEHDRLEELVVLFRKAGDPAHQFHAMVIMLLEELVDQGARRA